GEHTAIFAGLDEVVEIKHTATSKAVFAQGAVKAAKFIASQDKGLYNMKDVLELN
ncbi:4-hydroxy-tetrahydrodipicolinate reductase, partial [Clostridiaceae bacterium UIB06]|nr:4-hydroxy-tetrahydrodipicolinate reductase [Clostridiaceae bacterium UIB06]